MRAGAAASGLPETRSCAGAPGGAQVPVLVSELDLECQLWVKVRLAPLPPNVGTISLAFVGQPTVRVQLAPYNRIRIMRIPVLQARPATRPGFAPHCSLGVATNNCVATKLLGHTT